MRGLRNSRGARAVWDTVCRTGSGRLLRTAVYHSGAHGHVP